MTKATMETIRHHITDAMLMAYSAGTLPEAFSLVTATHISMCDECRARLGSFEAVGGAVIDEIETTALGDDCLAATLERIRRAPRVAARPRPRADLPQPLAEYVGGGLDAVRWRSVGGGVRQSVFPSEHGATARLLLIPAGMSVPDHGHRGTEMTLVLRGAFRDETDRFGPGDVETADEALEHQPVAERGEDCICLAASDAPMRFRGLIPRLIQPFIGI